MKQVLIAFTIVLSFGCKTETKELSKFEVKYKGALKNMMHKGDISAKADLKTFNNAKHFYALGAFENLKGEIQIFDSKPYNTKVVDSTLNFDKSFNNKATLLVYASINSWKSIDIPEDVKTYKQLESYIQQTAKNNAINSDKPFPFLIEGTAESFNWHVINWKDGDMEHSHQKHVNSGLNGTERSKKATFLGFYSNSHHAIFTHHTTNMHIHVKTDDNTLAGHVDALTIGENMILKIPNTI